MALYNWSTTAATNATADPSINWAEGQAPSSVNDSARAMMAAVAKWRDDMGANIQTAGSTVAYTLTTNQVFDSLAHMANQEITFYVTATNGANPTLNVDGLGAKAIVGALLDTGLPAGTLIANSIYSVTYSNSAGQFLLRGFYGNPFNVPVGAGMDYWGATVPNSNFAFANGAAISRTTYATLFAIIGTTYGAGDGSTTFNLPDKTGRVSAGMESSASRLTTAGGGVDGGTLGAVGGAQSVTLSIAQLPVVTPAGTISSVTAAGTNSSVTAAGTISSVTAAGTISTITPAGTISSITPAGTISQITPAGSVSVTVTTPNVLSGGVSDNYTSVAGTGTWNTPTRGSLAATGSFTGTPTTPTFSGSSTTPTFTGSSTTPTFTGTTITPTFTGTTVTPTFSGTTVTPTFTGTSFGSGQSHALVQPTIICNYIIRII